MDYLCGNNLDTYVNNLRQATPYIKAYSQKKFIIILDENSNDIKFLECLAEDIKLLNSLNIHLLVHASVELLEILFRIIDVFKEDISISKRLQQQKPTVSRIYLDKDITDYTEINSALDQNHIILLNSSSKDSLIDLSLQISIEKLIFIDSKECFVQPSQISIKSLLEKPHLSNELQINKDFTKFVLEHYKNLEAKGKLNRHLRYHIISKQEGALLKEIFTLSGEGILIFTDNYSSIREARIEDIPTIMEFINPLVESNILLNRTAEDVKQQINNFRVAVFDNRVVGCLALKYYEDNQTVELNCLAVDNRYQNNKIGASLIKESVKFLKEQNIKKVFLLTLQATSWFIPLGFKESNLDEIPDERKINYDKKRNSQVLVQYL